MVGVVSVAVGDSMGVPSSKLFGSDEPGDPVLSSLRPVCSTLSK